MYLAGASLSYLAWAGVHAADAKRMPSTRLTPAMRRGLRWGGWGLAVAVLIACSAVMGAERGLFTGLGLLTLAGAALVFSLQIWPRAYKPTLLVCAGLAIIGSVGVIF